MIAQKAFSNSIKKVRATTTGIGAQAFAKQRLQKAVDLKNARKVGCKGKNAGKCLPTKLAQPKIKQTLAAANKRLNSPQNVQHSQLSLLSKRLPSKTTTGGFKTAW